MGDGKIWRTQAVRRVAASETKVKGGGELVDPRLTMCKFSAEFTWMKDYRKRSKESESNHQVRVGFNAVRRALRAVTGRPPTRRTGATLDV